jgi:hypothetical protein
MTIKFIRGNKSGTKVTPEFVKGVMPVKRDAPLPPPVTVPAPTPAPAGSITAQKKATIAANKEATEAIAYFFDTWCGNIADPYRGP